MEGRPPRVGALLLPRCISASRASLPGRPARSSGVFARW